MSDNFRYYKIFYDLKFVTKDDLKSLVEYGVLTKAEYKNITGEDYTE